MGSIFSEMERMGQMIKIICIGLIRGDDPDGSVHVCRPVQPLCRSDCTNAVGQDMFISESKNEMVSSSPGVQTFESAYTFVQHVMNPLNIPEKSAHTPYISYIYQSFQEIGVKSPVSSVHECLHTGCTGLQRMHKNQRLISVRKERLKIIGIMDIHPEMFHETEKLTVLLCVCCGRYGVSYCEKGGSKSTLPELKVPMTVFWRSVLRMKGEIHQKSKRR